MSPVGDIARRQKLGHQFYADDSQLYVNCKANTIADSALTNLEACIGDINHWMLVNLLKLNDKDRNHVIWLSRIVFKSTCAHVQCSQ